jgi:hypothetical protein
MNKIRARFVVLLKEFGTHDERMVSFLNCFQKRIQEGDLSFAGFPFAFWKHFVVSEFGD